MITTLAVVAEVCALLPDHLATVFLQSIERSNFTLIHVPESELSAIAALMTKYVDRPMDFADASLIWLSDASGVTEIATIDSGFHVYRTKRGRSLRNRFPRQF